MANENKRVRVLYGEFAGRELDFPADLADSAISEKWGVDPYAPVESVDPNAPPVEGPSFEDIQTATEAAAAGIAKMRNPEPPKEDASAASPTPAASSTPAPTSVPKTPATATSSRRGTSVPSSDGQPTESGSESGSSESSSESGSESTGSSRRGSRSTPSS